MLKKIVCLGIVALFVVGLFSGLGGEENNTPVIMKYPPTPKYDICADLDR